jgi:hypothetical protein
MLHACCCVVLWWGECLENHSSCVGKPCTHLTTMMMLDEFHLLVDEETILQHITARSDAVWQFVVHLVVQLILNVNITSRYDSKYLLCITVGTCTPVPCVRVQVIYNIMSTNKQYYCKVCNNSKNYCTMIDGRLSSNNTVGRWLVDPHTYM